MKGERKYYVIIFVVFLILFLIQQTQKEPTNYDHSFSHWDKNPYGGYVLGDLLPSFLGNSEVKSLNLTVYEIEDDLLPETNLVIIADGIAMGQEDADVLLESVHQGMTAFISAQLIGGVLADTLGFKIDQNEIDYVATANLDTSSVQLQSQLLEGKRFRFKKDAMYTYFTELDSIEHVVLAENEEGKPVALRIPWGQGELILNTTPLAFTNNYLFFEENAEYASALLSFLPQQPTIWTEYYQLGRLEIPSPLRVVLTEPPLKLAYGIVLISLVLFMIFEAKRKQRIIPVITPLKNSTVDFIQTIGNLYLKNGDHKDIAMKRIQYFLEYIRAKYYMNFENFSPDFFEKLSAKSGHDEILIKKLFDLITRVKNQVSITENELRELSNQIEIFYGRGK